MKNDEVSSIKKSADSTRDLVNNMEEGIKTGIDVNRNWENPVILGNHTISYVRYEMDE